MILFLSIILIVRSWVRAWTSYLHLCTSDTKRCNLVPVKKQ